MVQALTGDSLGQLPLAERARLPGPDRTARQRQPSQDLHLGRPAARLVLFYMADRLEVTRHYQMMTTRLRAQARRAAPRNRTLFQFASQLAACLTFKADLRTRARTAYLAGDRGQLLAAVRDTNKTISAMQRLWRAHRKVWLEENKPFGLETRVLRYGGQLSRLHVFRDRLRDHLAGRAERIEELEVKPQNFLGNYPFHGRKYRGTASPVFSVWV